MDTRAPGGGIEVSSTAGAGRPEIEVRREAPPVVVPDPARRSGRTAALVVAVVVALLLAGLAAFFLLGDDGDDDVVTVPAAGPAEPAALTVQVDPPAPAVAGQPVTLVVHYADGLGVFSGSTEDWGDGVGVGSAKNGSCSASTSPGPVKGSYQATHTFADAGTFPVAIEVITYTCDGGSVVEEKARATVDVTVTAAS